MKEDLNDELITYFPYLSFFPTGAGPFKIWISSQPIKTPENILETSHSFFRNRNQNSKNITVNFFTRGTQFKTEHIIRSIFKTIFVEINPVVSNTLECWE